MNTGTYRKNKHFYKIPCVAAPNAMPLPPYMVVTPLYTVLLLNAENDVDVGQNAISEV